MATGGWVSLWLCCSFSAEGCISFCRMQKNKADLINSDGNLMMSTGMGGVQQEEEFGLLFGKGRDVREEKGAGGLCGGNSSQFGKVG